MKELLQMVSACRQAARFPDLQGGLERRDVVPTAPEECHVVRAGHAPRKAADHAFGL